MSRYILEEDFDIIIENVEFLLENNEIEKLEELLETLHPADIAEILMDLEDDLRDKLFGYLDWEVATDVLEELNSDTFSELIKTLSLNQRIVVLDMMSQDDMVDKLGELTEQRKNEILSYLDKDDAEDVKELLVYDEDTAGGIMTKDFVVLMEDQTCYKAIDTLRETAPDAETIYYVFVVDQEEKLVGVLSLRELIIAKGNTLIKDIMNENVLSVRVDDDQEEVAGVVSKYDLLAVPVIDDQDRMIGLITVDDIIDVIEEEATEDILKFVASSDIEDVEEEEFVKRIKASVRARLPWLIIMIFGGLASATVLNSFQSTIDSNATLALFMPLIAGMGGNVGTQSSTLTVRSIAVGNITGKDVYRTIFHEMLTGFFIGMVTASITALMIFFMKGNDYMIAAIVGVSMWANSITAATVGSMVPLTFKKMGIDPAVASAPFITTAIDIIGLTIYFTLATMMLINLG